MANSYLMWIGSAHYTDIAEYSNETIVHGVSKRVPNAAVAKAMMEKGAVVFVAHDEGEKHDCPSCVGTIECPSCRKIQTAIGNEQERLDSAKGKLGDLAPSKSQERTIRISEEKIAKWGEEIANCEECDGAGVVTAGTGGVVTLKDDDVWDYRRYTYWRNCNKLDTFDYINDVARIAMCPDCGGFGTLPDGKVFGMFIPERTEYIVDAGDSVDKLKEIAKTATLIYPDALKGEAKRKCGYRHPGGVYVVSDPKGGKPLKTRKALEALKKAGVDVDAVEVHGAFVKFPEPVVINERRFRGIKRWDFVPVAASDAADDVVEAMA